MLNMEEPIARVCDRLYAAANLRGMSQKDLSEALGVGSGCMSHYFNGRVAPKQDRILKLAEILDVNPAWLIGYDVPMERQNKKLLDDLLTEMDDETRILIEKIVTLSHDQRKAIAQIVNCMK